MFSSMYNLFNLNNLANKEIPLYYLIDSQDLKPQNKTEKSKKRTYEDIERETQDGNTDPYGSVNPNLSRGNDFLVDLGEYSDSYIMEADVPGFSKKDLTINFDPATNTLTLKGTYIPKLYKNKDLVTVEDVPELEDYDDCSISSHSGSVTSIGEPENLICERPPKCDFIRSFNFKKPVLAEQTKASITDGVLRLIIPKAATSKIRRININ